MSRWLSCLFALAGCGRFGFDEVSHVGSDTGGDASSDGAGADGEIDADVTACVDPAPTGTCGTASAGIARVQVVPDDCAQGTLCQLIAHAPTNSLAITETAGDLLVVFAYGGQNPGGSNGGTAPNLELTVTDTLGNAYLAGPFVNNARYDDSAAQIFFAPSALGGANTITVTETAPQTEDFWTGVVVAEYAGVATRDAVDVSSVQGAPSRSAVAMPAAITTRAACDLIVGGMVNGHQVKEPDTAGPGWVEPILDEWTPAAVVDNAASPVSANTTAQAAIQLALGPDDGWAATQVAFRARSAPALCQPTQLAFTSAAQVLGAGHCSTAVVIASENAAGAPTITGAGIALALGGAGVDYFADAACAFPITTAQIGAGTSTTTIYYTASAAGTPTLTASASGFADATQAVTIQ